MNTDAVIVLARKYIAEGTMQSSARLCLADAVELQARGELVGAKRRALDSLRFTVGILHPDYKRAAK